MIAVPRSLAFPYLPIVSGPTDLVSYLILRFATTRFMHIPPLRRWFFRLLPEVVVAPPQLNGTTLRISARDPSQATILQEIFIENVYDLEKVPFRPAHIVDCGAHVGMFSLLAHARFPDARYTLFEPNPENVATLERTLRDNGLRFEVVPSVVSDVTGSVRFRATNSIEGTMLPVDSDPDGSQEVASINLAEFLRWAQPEVLLLKMDIEGHETVVLPAIMPELPKRTAIYFETHDGELGWASVAGLLASHGFTVECTRRRDVFRDGVAVRL